MVQGRANLPYNIKLGNYWFKVASDPATGGLRWMRTPAAFFPARISDKAVTQASMPPDVRVPYTFADHSGGMGLEKIEGAEAVSRYYYSSARNGNIDEGIDTSLGSQVILSAEVNRYTLPVTPLPATDYRGKFYFAPYRQMFFMGVGRYLFAKNNVGVGGAPYNSWSLYQDFGAGYYITDIIEYRGTQSDHYLYVAFGSTNTIQYQLVGGSFTAVNGGHTATFFCKVEDRLYRMNNNTLDYMTNGGQNPSFSGPIDIGDNVGQVTGLYNHANRVVIGKQQGLFILAADSGTLDQNLLPEFWQNPRTDYVSFSRGVNFQGNLVTLYKKGLAAFGTDFSYTTAGLNALKDNTSPVTGNAIDIASDNNHVYHLLDSGYIIKGVVNRSGGNITSIVNHPWLYIGANSTSIMGYDPVSTALYVLQGNQILRMSLSPTGNPLEYSGYRYCPGGTLYEPAFYAGFYQENKQYYSILVDGKNLSSTAYVINSYKTQDTAQYTSLTSNVQNVSPGLRIDLATPPTSRTIWTAVTLVTTDPYTTPILRSHTVSYVVLADPIMTMTFTLDLTEGAMLEDGLNNRLHADLASTRLQAMVNAGAVSLIDPWGRNYDVSIPLEGFLEQGGEHHYNRDPDMMVTIKAITQRQRIKGTFASLAQRTFGELKAYRFRILETL